MESFTLFIYRNSDLRFISFSGSYFEGLSFIFQSLSLFLWVLVEPTLSFIKKKNSVHFSSFTWLFELITVSSFRTKSFHSDIVHMPKSLDRVQSVSDLDARPHWTWSTLSSVVPLHMRIPRKWKSGADTHCVLSRSQLWDRKSFLWLWN